MKNITLKVLGMTCGHCVKSIETALKEKNILGKADLKNKSVNAQFDESKIKESEIKSILSELGYEVQ